MRNWPSSSDCLLLYGHSGYLAFRYSGDSVNQEISVDIGVSVKPRHSVIVCIARRRNEIRKNVVKHPDFCQYEEFCLLIFRFNETDLLKGKLKLGMH